jgi:hypothetical protein
MSSQCEKALSSLRFVVLSLFREREREREKRRERSVKSGSFYLLLLFFLFAFLFSQSVKRESMKASSSKSQETDASPLSEQKQPLTELRFRFRSSALKQSPSSDALLHDGEEEDFLEEEDQLARYVEPPELPTLAMHKVFGTFLLEAFSYMRNV